MEINPFTEKVARFVFRPIADDARINILNGGIRSGKTTAMMLKFPAMCRYPVHGARIIAGFSKGIVYDNILSELLRAAECEASFNKRSGELKILGTTWNVIGERSWRAYERLGKIPQIGIAYIDELTLLSQKFFWDAMSRMSADDARFYATTNPGWPKHWLKTSVLDDPALRESGKLWAETITLDDNPYVSDQYREAVKRTFTGAEYRRYINGEWVSLESAS